MREEDIVRLVTEEVVKMLVQQQHQAKIPVALSNRHIHLSQKDLEQLFGPGYQLTKLKDLSQPGQFAAKETVRLVGPKGILQNVRILGPTRTETQIELSVTDGFQLGIKPPVRPSGHTTGTPGCTIVGSKGSVDLLAGVIVAQRHIHMSPEDAKRFGVRDQEIIAVRSQGVRSLVFGQVLVRVSPNFSLEMHLDMEEGNAAGLKNGDLVEIIKEG